MRTEAAMGSDDDARMEARAQEHLQAGETFRVAIWVSKADGRTPTGMTRAEMSPLRFRRSAPARVTAARATLAEGLGEHVRLVTEPRVLALTDRRLMLLSKRIGSWRDLLRPAAGGLASLRVRWECPRAELASATEKDGRLRLAFGDGSTILLLTPYARIQAFIGG
ncbi:hypothetical protein [Actinoplanes sp. HUAS TT8]|uniref:hypothetical protein n=1 Tax=Actinoplanes sp. HUAS TT8 TaxID=3447453 RepID=UPI003F528382